MITGARLAQPGKTYRRRRELLEFLGLGVSATPEAIRVRSSARDENGGLAIYHALRNRKGVGLVRGLVDAGRGGAAAGQGHVRRAANPPRRGV